VAEYDPYRAAEDYVGGVLAGDITVGRYVRKAIERHKGDLEAPPPGCYFCPDSANHALRFFGFLKHSKGEWAGKPFLLAGWQAFILLSLFGWKRADHSRRFRNAYVEVARKNGKSTLAAGIGLYMFVGDSEPGAEVYSAATKRDQAIIVHSEAVRMVKASAALSGRVKAFKNNLSIIGTASKYEPLGADTDGMDGLNVHCAIIDELHAHKRRDLYDVIETATGARREPLLFNITTAGYNRKTVCGELRERCIKTLEGVHPDDSQFAYMAELDPDDDWADPTNWGKANPNLGITVKPESLEDGLRNALESLGYRNTFKRLRLDIWTEQYTKWITADTWKKNDHGALDLEDLAGRFCYGGLDLSSTTDLAAFVLAFPEDEAGHIRLIWNIWVPEDTAAARSRADRVPYVEAIDAGYMTGTPGNVVDYDYIRADVNRLAGLYDVREIAYDPWNATDLATKLAADGLELVQHRQGFGSMAAPTKHFERLLTGGRLSHGGNPIADWCAAHVAVRQDPAGNLKPAKDQSADRIDPIVAAIMAVGRLIANTATTSVYEEPERGVFFL
jgi:phage terminase large subunit-like protein